PFGRDLTFFNRRMLEAGNRLFEQNSNTFRVVVGTRGRLPEYGTLNDWTWDIYGNFGRTETINTENGRFNRSRIVQALGPDADCTGNCVPLNLLGGAGTITQEMIDYITYTGIDRGFSEQNIFAANAAGSVYELVEGAPIAVAFGYEFRDERGADIPNPLRVSGDATGNRRGITQGGFEVHAGYGELSVPLLANLPGAHSLELNAAGRLVNFNSFGSNFSGKLGIRWQPVDFAAIRGTYSTAFRAPSVSELFSGQFDSFETASDPCSSVDGIGSLGNATVAANCANDNLPDGVPDPATQLRTLQGGNPELEPETATIWTLGFVLEDKLIRGLTLAIDYYNIEIDNAVQTIGTANILSSCYESPNREFCDLIRRSPQGFIVDIVDVSNNVGGFKAQGIDFNLRYARPTPVGLFGAGVEGTVLLELAQV
ncbi:MAG: TonB-dependent receptor, partial [Myxococcota bacterium]